jgi:uncharacterized protein YeaO (DUF488 family)
MRWWKETPDPSRWRRFAARYRGQMNRESKHLLDLLAALSHQSNLSVACYCADETICHRSVLRELLLEQGAKFV